LLAGYEPALDLPLVLLWNKAREGQLLNVVLWVVQIVLALGFLTTGILKVTQSREKLLTTMPFVEDFSQNVVRAIGWVEILGAIGIVLPQLTGILPWLTPLAAAGLVLLMIGATFTNVRRHERRQLANGLVLMLLAVVVLVGRWPVVPS